MRNKRKKNLALVCGVLLICVLAWCGFRRMTVEEPEAVSNDTKTVSFVDAVGNTHSMEVSADAPLQIFDSSSFVKDGEKMTYTDDSEYTYRLGVDVSEHQGEIDWTQVKAAGYEFAIIRVAYRGYTEGKLNVDATADTNIKNALAAGLEVGVYVFSQAINEEEAVEEASLALESIKGYNVTGPIVYDPETISEADSRTDDVTTEQFTKNSIAFCEKVKAAGYTPIIYANMMWEAYKLDLTQLSEYEFWYADYEPVPQTPYAFTYWQYSESGSVPGINGTVDLNIHMIKK